jgi:predicted  nucleic acid-binding Zn-ribbon protein
MGGMTTKGDIASVAGQLAGLTRTVEEMADQLHALQKSAVTQQERSNAQQDRIDHAARELAEVSARLQAAAHALRQAL